MIDEFILMPIFTNFAFKFSLRLNVYSKIFDMSTIISVYLFVAFSVLVIRAFFKRVPQLLAFIVLVPVAPFMVAWKNRKERPITSWILLVLWLLVYLVALVIMLVSR